ncbi:TonB-dependent receptor [Comamonas sp. Y33R10-2]|uniref:TonB-dependent receptor domain-containing protein n=1 Tax=Comamonas sp. Y33R10-2 TaxID=2853257 RepID=UPI001C5CB136|nr:TonB-dependent receptor [Comamonas sp. Y33R10-2]QXZ10945.1 TonB-dependent receptor [Comamonas sp. Y33R10-2]
MGAGLGLLTASPLALAQQESSLAEVTVSATGMAAADMATPVQVLGEEELRMRRGATLGETLAAEPGINASHFGAGASRPVIRGMDGARVSVLSDGSELLDASTVSPDHAVTSEPMLAKQVEVLRGPSALLYSAGAMGGVVNVLDNKIPTHVPEKGVEGSAEVQAGTAAGMSAGAFSLTTATPLKNDNGQLVLHAEGVARNAGDYRVGSGWGQGKVPGSFSRGNTGSVGLSWVTNHGYLGLAYTRQQATYGLPGHQHSFEGCHAHGDHLHCGGDHAGHVHGGGDEHDHAASSSVPVVELTSERWDLRGEWRNPTAGITALRLRGGLTNYRHNEVEGGSIATQFKNKAHDLRLELEHQPIAGWRGTLGLQTLNRRFSATGEEAYVQPTETQRNSLYLLEEYRWQDWSFQAALRHDRQRIDAQLSDERRSHSATSTSLGAAWKFQPGYSATASFTSGSRMPTAEELFANGLHMATSTYELGNANLSKERSQALDLGLAKTMGDTRWKLNAYHYRINGYIYGATLDAHEGLQLLQYTQGNARFTGWEAQLTQRINRELSVTVFGDGVRASLEDGSALPRIPALRAGLRVNARLAGWDGMAEWTQVLRQNRTAEYESQTAGYGMLNLGASYQWRSGGNQWQVYVKGQNLTNRLAYAATSFIKTAAPLTGRNLVVGLRLDF